MPTYKNGTRRPAYHTAPSGYASPGGGYLTKSELIAVDVCRASGLVTGLMETMPTSKSAAKAHECGNAIIELAEKIKAERAVAGMGEVE